MTPHDDAPAVGRVMTDTPAERDAYRCKGCGEWFDDDNGGRHAVHDAGCDGSCRYCPVPCGPIVLYERATPSAPQEARESEAIERPCGCEDDGRLRFTAREWLRAWHKAGVRELLAAAPAEATTCPCGGGPGHGDAWCGDYECPTCGRGPKLEEAIFQAGLERGRAPAEATEREPELLGYVVERQLTTGEWMRVWRGSTMWFDHDEAVLERDAYALDGIPARIRPVYLGAPAPADATERSES